MHTVPVHRHGGNDFLAIKVILSPFALFQLLQPSLIKLTNRFIDAAYLWGNEVSVVCNGLKALNELPGMINVIEGFKEFSGLTPAALYQLEAKAPERCFGYSYQT